jgi:hypothetical protein
LATLLAVLIVAAPLSGAVCTMSCGDGGGPCCCESPGGDGILRVSAESCCGPEANSPAAANLTADRLAAASPASFFPVAAADAFIAAEGPVQFLKGSANPAQEQARGRSSPLFLLNVSFLI